MKVFKNHILFLLLFQIHQLAIAQVAIFETDSPPNQIAENLDIYLVIGQSNMAGRATIREKDTAPLADTYLFTGDEATPFVVATNPLNRYSTVRKKMSMQRLGPSFAFAQSMVAEHPDHDIGLVVNAKGGTKIVQWLPGTELYEEAISQTHKALKYGTLRGVIWHQGEGDSHSIRVDMYLGRLEILISAIREEFNDPNLPFIAGQLYDNENRHAFNEMLLQLPGFIKHTGVALSAGTNTTDGTHFDSESAIIMGNRYAAEMKKIQTGSKKKQAAEWVYPLLDAANSRWFFFSSATRPFGMVNLSPDMGVGGAWDSGYRYNRDTINFFSHIHAWQLSGIPVLPLTGDFKGHLGAEKYGSRYSHENEVVRAGYHAVELETYGIKAELTATTRVGFHRYAYPAGEKKYLLLDLGTILGPSGTEKGYAKQVGKDEIAGYALMAPTRRRPKATYVYYSIQFDAPFENMLAWQNGKLLGETKQFDGSDGGVYVQFKGKEAQTVQMKVAISYVSTEQARLNMKTELPHWNFDQVADEAFKDWNSWLSRIEVEGGTDKEKSRFYTDLWHALQGRRIISDANGKYCDMTGDAPRVGQIPLDDNGKPSFHHYNSDSFWGAQWTLNTLWHLVYPEVSEGFVNSMLMMYDDGGLIPRGPSGGNYTYVMTGASSTPFIVSAYMKGIRGFDVNKAYEGLRKNAMPGGIMGKAGYEHTTELGGGLSYYIDKGYVPYPVPEKNNGYHNEGAGQTLEYAYQDWCLSQMAKSLGKTADAILFANRANNYKNVWDKGTGWMRPRELDGSWSEPFNPILSHHGFVESTATQSTWFVPHDMNGLFDLMGGPDKAALKLNQQFQIADVHDFISKSFKSDRFVHKALHNTYLNYGNQPSMQVGFVFNYTGKPWLTQYWTREVTERIYSHLDPQNGYNGDEDQGLMGALSVLLKLGLFEMKGGAAIEPIYEIGSPIFDKVTIKLNSKYYPGGKFVIETKDNSSKNRYIQSAVLNGKTWNNAWFYHDELVKGGSLILKMGDQPNKEWGSSQLPSSMSTDSN